jgi:hypothetical protein
MGGAKMLVVTGEQPALLTLAREAGVELFDGRKMNTRGET